MPTYRSITISVVSQFDIKDIPEYPPPKNAKDPFSSSPTVLASERGVASVYIPTFPSSRFWLSYSIYPPYPPKAFYFFKLFLTGVCVQSWGCGEEEKYKGKTMFGLFDSGEVYFDERAVEKRILCFASEGLMAEKTPDKLEGYVDDPKDVMEVKVYRSKGRKRIRPEVKNFEAVAAAKNSTLKRPKEGGGGISLVHGGFLSSKKPQRYYKYALLDPLDQPFATFRYYYRSIGKSSFLPISHIHINSQPCSQLEQLEILGIKPTELSTSRFFLSAPVLTPQPEHPICPAPESITNFFSTSTTTSTASKSDGNDAESSSTPQPAVALNSISKPTQVLGSASPAPESFRSSSPSKNPIDLTPRSPSRTTQTHFTALIRAISPSKGHRPLTPAPDPRRSVRRSGSMTVLMDVVNGAMKRRSRAVSVERDGVREEVLLPNNDDEVLYRVGDENKERGGDKKSGESDDKESNITKQSVTEASNSSTNDELTALHNNTDTSPPKAPKSSGESSRSNSSPIRERTEQTDKVKRRDLCLWEKLAKKYSTGHEDTPKDV